MLPAFRETIVAFRAKEYKSLADLMPRTIERCMDHPPMRLLMHDQVVGRPALMAYIHAELIHLTKQLNVANTMDTAQMLFTADTILDNFNTDTLADITLALRRGAQGYYGSTYHQLDCSIIIGWIKQHLEEKAMFIERDHATGKDTRKEEETQIDYMAYIQRTEQERIKERNEKITRFENSVGNKAEERSFRKAYVAPEPISLALQELIKDAAAARYGHLHVGEFKYFFNHDVGDGIRIFARSEEDAKQILLEAETMIELNKTKTKTNYLKQPDP